MRVHHKQANASNCNDTNDKTLTLQAFDVDFIQETGMTSRDLPLFKKQQNRN